MKEIEKKIKPFAETRLSDWEKAAREELKGVDPWKKLSVTSNGVLLKPIYGPETSRPDSFVLKKATTDVRGARSWFNCPRIVVSDPEVANVTALEHLEAGADGIFFELRGATDFRRLLKKIVWPYCALHFATESNDLASVQALEGILSEVKGQAAGAWFGSAPVGITHPTFRFGGFAINATSPEVIGARIAEWLRSSPGAHASPAAVSIELGTDFFLDIAALRALRVVWQRVNPLPLYIHASSRPWKIASYEPHGNMLKATSAAMAAILGGADALTVDPEDASNTMQRRVARNVAILLREESRFAKVADPLAGCYFLDDLTEQVAGAIWNVLKPGNP